MASFTETDISATAVAVAHFRALESSRDDALFCDEFASLFVDASGLPVSGIGLSEVTSNRVYLSVAVRTHWLDAGVVDAASAGCRQVVLLGAGLDARAVRLDVPAQTRFFEIDLPNVLAFKRSVLAANRAEPRCEYIDVAADLTAGDWPTRLIDAGFDPAQPTVWVAEGILIYFDSSTNDRILDAVSEVSAAGSRLLCGHFGAGSLTEAQTREMTRRTSSAGYGFQSWVADPKAWLAEWGWDVTATTIKAHGATLGRDLPYEETPGREIAWLVAAARRSECA
ncbi:SAM-dependent methyltransferase [Nocardia sp. NPDC058519]|uniref:SAM-dependent methyltransferase n=1 Tax=unclassified Nocardia TaxID=2637762 RepID=UPI00365B61D8